MLVPLKCTRLLAHNFCIQFQGHVQPLKPVNIRALWTVFISMQKNESQEETIVMPCFLVSHLLLVVLSTLQCGRDLRQRSRPFPCSFFSMTYLDIPHDSQNDAKDDFIIYSILLALENCFGLFACFALYLAKQCFKLSYKA